MTFSSHKRCHVTCRRCKPHIYTKRDSIHTDASTIYTSITTMEFLIPASNIFHIIQWLAFLNDQAKPGKGWSDQLKRRLAAQQRMRDSSDQTRKYRRAEREYLSKIPGPVWYFTHAGATFFQVTGYYTLRHCVLYLSNYSANVFVFKMFIRHYHSLTSRDYVLM